MASLQHLGPHNVQRQSIGFRTPWTLQFKILLFARPCLRSASYQNRTYHRTFAWPCVSSCTLQTLYVAEARFSTVEFVRNAQHRSDEMIHLLVTPRTTKLKYSTPFTTPQSSQIGFNTTRRAVLLDIKARRGFHVKVAATRSHHEAKPRREYGLAKGQPKIEVVTSVQY